MTRSRRPTTSRLRRLLAGLLPLAVAGAALATPAAAQEDGAADWRDRPVVRDPGEVSNVVEELSQEIYSPFCPGKTLAMCPSGGAAQVRRTIQQMARHGVSKEEIKEKILEKHGEKFRFEEPPTEDNYPLIAIILLALLVCASAVYFFVRTEGTDEPDGDVDEDWSEEEEIYLEEIRDDYRD